MYSIGGGDLLTSISLKIDESPNKSDTLATENPNDATSDETRKAVRQPYVSIYDRIANEKSKLASKNDEPPSLTTKETEDGTSESVIEASSPSKFTDFTKKEKAKPKSKPDPLVEPKTPPTKTEVRLQKRSSHLAAEQTERETPPEPQSAKTPDAVDAKVAKIKKETVKRKRNDSPPTTPTKTPAKTCSSSSELESSESASPATKSRASTRVKKDSERLRELRETEYLLTAIEDSGTKTRPVARENIVKKLKTKNC